MMTRQAQKDRERFFVEEASRLLGRNWLLGPNRERPDFIVTEGTHQFGLEVSEIFTGPQERSGSKMKKSESNTCKMIESFRRKYESAHDIPLTVKLVGTASASNLATVVASLIDRNLEEERIGHHYVFDTNDGLRVHVTKSFRREWYSVDDRVGFVDRSAINQIVDAVSSKAKELPRYQAAAGADVRLLVVADRFLNSGKLILEGRPHVDRRSFDTVYFFSYPETVTVFDGN